MSWWDRWRKRDEELDEEVRAHLRMAAQLRVDRGETPEEAARAARREFGNELLVKEVARETSGFAALERFLQDLRYGFRQMRRSPGFTAIALLTLALGLGATTAMFSLVNGVLLQPLKYREPKRLYMAQTVAAPRFKAVTPWPVNARHFHEWRAHGTSWEQIALAGGLSLTLTASSEPQRLPGYAVSYNFFRTLGVQPALGRDFLPEEELPGRFHVVILTDSLWRTHFAANPSIVGRTISLGGEPHVVVGVMPPALSLPKGGEWGPGFENAPVIFRPLGFDVSQGRASGEYSFGSIVRLKPGVQPQQAVAEMNALIAELVRQFHIESKPGLTPMLDQVTAGVQSSLWLLLGTVGAVLLIVCVNVGNLMLVRTSGRYREAGVRMALGAGRRQLFGMVLSEAIVLVAIGGALGSLLAYAGLKAFVAAAPVSLPRLDEIHVDWRVLTFALAAMGLSTFICGLAPAWRLSRIAPLESLKSSVANTEFRHRLRFREAMVSVEVALSTILLIVGGLLLLSFFRVIRADQGFEVSRVIAQDFSLTRPAYNDVRRHSFIESALLKLGNVPGVESASMIDQVPLRGDAGVCGLRDPDRPLDPVHPDAASNFAGLASWRFVAPDYWKTMGIPLKSGRGLDPSDQNREVAVVSQRVAQLLWPSEDPIGKHVNGCGAVPGARLEVIGVVGETRLAPEREPPLMVYQPYWDVSVTLGSFVLRTHSDPATVIGALHQVLRSMDSELPIAPARTMQQILDESVAGRRFEMDLSVAFAAAALLLASFGIYGIVSFAVARRTPEIGIRMALGARPLEIVAMVLRQGMLPVLAGLGAGLACALLLGRLLASELFGVSPHDPVTLSAVTTLLVSVALFACLVPSRRAARIDPVRALRSE